MPCWALGIVAVLYSCRCVSLSSWFCCAPWCAWVGPAGSVLFSPFVCLLLLSFVVSLSPRFVLFGALVQFYLVCWYLPLGVWLQLWRLSCPALVLGVWLCSVIPPSHVSWQQRLLALCGVFTLYTILQVMVGSLVWPHWGIHQDDDPVPTSDSAKLHYCYSNVIGAACSAPVLLCHPGTPLLVIVAWAGCSVLFLLGYLWPCHVIVATCVSFLYLCALPCSHSGSSEWSLESSVRTSLTCLFECVTLSTDWRGTVTASLWTTKVTQNSQLVWCPYDPSFCFAGLLTWPSSLCGAFLSSVLNSFFFLGLLGTSSVWVLYLGSCIHPRGAVVSRPMPWTRLCCSEPHRCTPVVFPLGLPGAPTSSTRLPAWFVS